MRFTIPNILTLLRLVLIPVFVIVFYIPASWAPFAAAMVFWVAGFTERMDECSVVLDSGRLSVDLWWREELEAVTEHLGAVCLLGLDGEDQRADALSQDRRVDEAQ